LRGNWLDAPSVAFYGIGNDSRRADRNDFSYGVTTVGVSARLRATQLLAVGGGLDVTKIETSSVNQAVSTISAGPEYRTSHVFAEFDSRTAPLYTKSGGLYRVEWSDYQQTNAGALSFQRVDAEVQRFVPITRESRVIALRALA